jgi:hypothetical protein
MTDCPHFRTALELREGARPLGPEAAIESERLHGEDAVLLADWRPGHGDEWLQIDAERVVPCPPTEVPEQ